MKPIAAHRAVPFPGVRFALAFLAGVLVVHALPELAPRWLDAAMVVVAALLGVHPRLRPAACCLLGFAWCAFRAGLSLDERLPHALEGRDFDLVGVVEGLPRRRDDSTSFVLRVDEARLGDASLAWHARVQVSWYADPPPVVPTCSRWNLTVRLKRPRGLVNRGAFDSERQALERAIGAVGTVREAPSNRLLGERAWCVDGLRDHLSRGIAERVADPHDAALLQAFAVGDTRGLDADDWSVARANGIPHLIAISGFHVGVAAAFGALLVKLLWWVWPRLGLALAFPIAEAPAALATAVLYGIVAGGSLPTVRTVVMIAVVASSRFGRRRAGGAQSLALALLAILLVDPLASLAPGFWLSFVGVAFLLLCLRRGHGVRAFLRELGAGQLVMTLSLLPLSVWFFGEASPVGALSNLIAVPLISFVIVPLCLLGILALLAVPALASPLLAVAAAIAHLQWALLAWMATWPGAHAYLPEAPTWSVALATLGAVWLFLPRGMPVRWLGALLYLPLLFPARSLPEEGAFEAFFIDVGQGLAVFVRTRQHALLFDAGARYPSGFDLGTVAVLPTLHALGARSLDRLMISHGDNDHAGGAPAVAADYPDAQRTSGEPERLPIPFSPCAAGQSWQWDGVDFRVLSPPERASGAPTTAGNDRSCVLLIAGAGGRLLLDGDIGGHVESGLVEAIGPGAPIVLQVAHHGSKTSSGEAFIAALQPVLAVASAGWRNRFGHPDPSVVARFRHAGVAFENTALDGAVHVRFPADAAPRLVSRERERLRRYWRE